MDLPEAIMQTAVEAGLSQELLDQFFEELGISGWVREDRKAYPPMYAYSLGRYRTNAAAIRKMREAIKTVPRVDPELYDILFNVEGGTIEMEGPTWDIVKWIEMPEMAGLIPGAGYMAAIVLEPYPIYHLPARRDPMSLSDSDWNHLFAASTTLKGGDQISREIRESNRKKKERRHESRADDDLQMAKYMRGAFKDFAEDKGI